MVYMCLHQWLSTLFGFVWYLNQPTEQKANGIVVCLFYVCVVSGFLWWSTLVKSSTSTPSPPHLLRPAQTNPSEKQMSSLSLLCFINFSVELSHFVAPECLLTNRGVRSLLFWLYDSVHFQLCLVKLCCDSHPLGLNGKVFGKDIIFKSTWPAVCNPFYFCKTTFHSNTACSTRSVRKVLSNSSHKNDSPSGHPRDCFFPIRTDLEKFSITSLAHQWKWILCSEWVPSEWESKQLIKTSQ